MQNLWIFMLVLLKTPEGHVRGLKTWERGWTKDLIAVTAGIKAGKIGMVALIN